MYLARTFIKIIEDSSEANKNSKTLEIECKTFEGIGVIAVSSAF